MSARDPSLQPAESVFVFSKSSFCIFCLSHKYFTAPRISPVTLSYKSGFGSTDLDD